MNTQILLNNLVTINAFDELLLPIINKCKFEDGEYESKDYEDNRYKFYITDNKIKRLTIASECMFKSFDFIYDNKLIDKITKKYESDGICICTYYDCIYDGNNIIQIRSKEIKDSPKYEYFENGFKIITKYFKDCSEDIYEIEIKQGNIFLKKVYLKSTFQNTIIEYSYKDNKIDSINSYDLHHTITFNYTKDKFDKINYKEC